MARYKYPKDETAMLPAVVAARLREIERQFSSLPEFARAAGISLAALHILRSGNGNPTSRSLEHIASRLGISIWTLLGVEPVQIANSLAREGLKLNEIREFIARQKKNTINGQTASLRAEDKAEPSGKFRTNAINR